LQSSAACAPEPAQVARIFRRYDMDLDDLAEAVRALLEHGGGAGARCNPLSERGLLE
jgi:hypothetical protein